MAVRYAKPLRISGLTPMTTIDYPGEIAAVVFCQGCPWRCRYCHNGHLLTDNVDSRIDWRSIRAFLDRRRGLLDAVVFSGGEPTAQAALGAAVREVRRGGFRSGLHTGGAYPDRLAALIDDLDWIGLDIKAMPEDYPALTGVQGSGERAWRSLEILASSGVAFDIRITVHEQLLPAARLNRLVQTLKAAGINNPVIQPCRSNEMLDPSLGPNRFVATRLSGSQTI
jgi:pyruvate formate lyase activating enzyme